MLYRFLLFAVAVCLTFGRADAEECLASDLNGDGYVDFEDFLRFSGEFGQRSVGCATEGCDELRDSVQVLTTRVTELERLMTAIQEKVSQIETNFHTHESGEGNHLDIRTSIRNLEQKQAEQKQRLDRYLHSHETPTPTPPPTPPPTPSPDTPTLSLDIDASDNKMDDGNTSGTVSGAGTDVVIEVFIRGLAGPIIGGELTFNTNMLTIKSVAVGAGFLLASTDKTAAIGIIPAANLTHGHLATVTFTTASDVTGVEFTVGASVNNLAYGSGGVDNLTAATPLTFNGR